MIQIKKKPTSPIPKETTDRWTTNFSEKWEESKKNGSKPPNGNWNNFKIFLRDESHGKCTYCECTIEGSQHAHVEHYLPKSKHCDKSHDWNNLLYSCILCNTSKGDEDPYEKPFIDPINENPEDFFIYVEDNDLFRVLIKEKADTDIKAKNTIDFTNLNDKSESRDLNVGRWRFLNGSESSALGEALKNRNPTRENLEMLVSTIVGDDVRFAGMLRFFLKTRYMEKLNSEE